MPTPISLDGAADVSEGVIIQTETPTATGRGSQTSGLTTKGSDPGSTNGTHDASNGSKVEDDPIKANGMQSDFEAEIPLHNIPAYSAPRRIRVITIGAGFSGLIFAHKIRYEHPEMEEMMTNTIFESRSDIGGTWLANSYPGVRCDVPSHIYAFPFDPNPDWGHFYSTGPQIHAYMQKTIKKWNLDRDIQLNTRVTGVFWQEELGQWKVDVEHQGMHREEYADVLVSAQGFLSTWKWPNIPGLHDFQGHKVHSAAWDHSYDYSKKRIAVIGNGSSGIQILPQLAQLEGTDVTSFQRGPTWVVARMDPGKLLGKPNIGSNPAYTEEDKKLFRENPEALHRYRKNLIHANNRAFKMVSPWSCFQIVLQVL